MIKPLLMLLTLAALGGPAIAASAVGFDPKQVARGGELYRAHCAACHGANAEGAPNWHQKGADGKFPPPPLDAKGHAWHHPKSALAQTIREGTLRLGGAMPPWKDKLSDADIEAVIAWFQSRWPEDVYQSWARMDERSGAGMRR
jgi:mono/diheme cytochrome c family protein